jgi:hypothetical protein
VSDHCLHRSDRRVRLAVDLRLTASRPTAPRRLPACGAATATPRRSIRGRRRCAWSAFVVHSRGFGLRQTAGEPRRRTAPPARDRRGLPSVPRWRRARPRPRPEIARRVSGCWNRCSPPGPAQLERRINRQGDERALHGRASEVGLR